MEPVPAQQQRLQGRAIRLAGRHPVGWVDQVARREAFEAAHPSVKIRPHVIGQPWTALVQMPDGSEATVTDFWELGGLLDKLDALRTANDRLAQPGDDG